MSDAFDLSAGISQHDRDLVKKFGTVSKTDATADGEQEPSKNGPERKENPPEAKKE